MLRGISMAVEIGEVIAVIGASGSGKSTLLRCFNMLEEPTSGEIDFDGMSFQFDGGKKTRGQHIDLAAMRAEIGMVFQSYNLWPHMTVLENVIEAPIHVKKLSRKEATSIAKDLLNGIGLGEKMDDYPSKLSGGQQQRVAIVRALAMSPKLILFDEVTSALDPELVGEVLALIARLAKEGMTMILVTHEISFARDVSQRTIFIDQGLIAEEGRSDEVLENPRSDRTKQFLKRVLYQRS